MRAPFARSAPSVCPSAAKRSFSESISLRTDAQTAQKDDNQQPSQLTHPLPSSCWCLMQINLVEGGFFALLTLRYRGSATRRHCSPFSRKNSSHRELSKTHSQCPIINTTHFTHERSASVNDDFNDSEIVRGTATPLIFPPDESRFSSQVSEGKAAVGTYVPGSLCRGFQIPARSG